MIIRKEQQSEIGIDFFIKRLQEHWLDNFPHKFISVSNDEINQIASTAVQETEAKGIENEDVSVIYVDLCLVAGTGFAAQSTPSEKLKIESEDINNESEWSESDIGFAVLDVAGVVPVYEEDADITDAIKAAEEGNYLDAGLLLISVIPIVGYIIGKETQITKNWDPEVANKILEAIRDISVYRFLDRFKSNPKLEKYSKEILEKLEKWQSLVK